LAADIHLKTNWSLVKDWSEETRYHTMEKKEAEDLYDAIADHAHRVLQWIKINW
jgi:hypothetical protein